MNDEIILYAVRWIGVCFVLFCFSQCVIQTEPKQIHLKVEGQCDTIILDPKGIVYDTATK